MTACAQRTSITAGRFRCGLLAGVELVGETVCEICQGCTQGRTPETTEDVPALVKAATGIGGEFLWPMIDAAAIAEQEAHNARLAEVIQYPCAHRSDEPSNREEVCCESMWTYACTLGQFGGTVSVHQCAGCGKYE